MACQNTVGFENDGIGGVYDKEENMKRSIFFSRIGFLTSVSLLLVNQSSAQWVEMSAPHDGVSVTSIAVGGKNIFAGTSESGIFLSTDEGTTWKAVNAGLPSSAHIRSLTVNGTDVFAAIETGGFLDKTYGIYVSTNNGAKWSPVENWQIVGRAYTLASNGNRLIVGAEMGNDCKVYLSTNKGSSWSIVNRRLPANTVLNALAFIDSRVFAGIKSRGLFKQGYGVLVSNLDGMGWEAANSGLTNTEICGLAVSNTDIFAATNDGVFISVDNGASWSTTRTVFPDSSRISSLAVSGLALLVGTERGSLWRCPLPQSFYPLPQLPPSLTSETSLRTPSGNDILAAGEKGKIVVRLTNSGKGDAYGLKIDIEPHRYLGLFYPAVTEAGNLRAGKEFQIEIPVTADTSASTGKDTLVLKFAEANGFEPLPTTVVVSINGILPPKLVVSDIGVASSTGDTVIEPGRVYTISVRIRNLGLGEAKGVRANVRVGEHVFLVEASNASFSLGDLNPGDHNDISFGIYTNSRATEVPVYLDLAEHSGLYGVSNIELPLAPGKSNPSFNRVHAESKDEQAPNTEQPGAAEVDSDIPRAAEQHSNAVALILAIPQYQSSSIPEVKYAKNDAEVLRQYLIRALGFKPENILPMIPDEQLTYGRIQTYIKSILPSYLEPDGSSDLFIYYTGHGAPSAANHEAYLVPWDGDPNYVNDNNSYSMKKFYVDIELLNARHKIIAVDACFSGYFGSGETLLKSASPVYLTLNNPLVADPNTVIFQSSSVNQVSNWYDEKRHGMFTYFFLKGLQGAADYNHDGVITADELIKYVNDANDGLPYYSNRLYQRPQEAQLEGNGQTVIERVEK